MEGGSYRSLPQRMSGEVFAWCVANKGEAEQLGLKSQPEIARPTMNEIRLKKKKNREQKQRKKKKTG